MDIALMVEPQAGGSYQQLAALARWAEQQDLVAFARSDHYMNGDESLPATDALTSLAGLARDTERIRLTVLMTPLTFRHPGVIAKTAATIDEMSGGRFELGIGTGWMQSEHDVFGIDLPDVRTRFSLLFETLAYVRTALGREQAETYEGRHFALVVPDVQPRPTGKLPIVIGGGGPKKTPRLAGRFGDEYNMFLTDVATLQARLVHMRQAAAEVGRDPDEILISMATQVIGGEDEADYKDRLGTAAAARDTTPDELESRFRTSGFPCGTAEQLAERASELAAMGVGRLYLQRYADLGDISTEELASDVAGLRG